MGYETLSLNGFIDEMKEVSTGSHSRKFCFVIGAGASRSSGIKSGKELVDIWDKELARRNPAEYISWKENLGINERNKYGFYSHYYEKRYKRNPSDGYNCLEKMMGHAKPSSGYVMLAYLLSKTEHNVVLTTNFDHLIEDAVNYYLHSIPLVIGHESLTHYVTKKIKRPAIIKIHRDLLFDPANTVRQVDSLHENWQKALDIIFSEYHPVIIGYAGNDNSLMDYLVANGESFASGKFCCPYWMLYKNDAIDGKVEEFLQKANGYVIEHNGFDEALYFMGAAFGYKMPLREEFLGDAEERYKKLSEAIDSFTDAAAQNEESLSDSTDSGISLAIRQVTDTSELQRLYREASEYYAKKKYDGALPLFHKLTELEPQNARYHDRLGATLHRMERYDEALIESQRAVELEPENAYYHNSLGFTLHAMKRYDEALAAKQRAVDLEPDNVRYHDGLSSTFHAMKRYDEALVESQRAVELEPENAYYHNSLGITLPEMGRYDEAIAAKQRAVELEPKNAYYHNSLGFTLHAMKRYDEALAAKQRALELDPNNKVFSDSLEYTRNAMK